MKNKINNFLVLFSTILYYEILFKSIVKYKLLSLNIVYIIIFSFLISLILSILTNVFKPFINKIIFYIINLILLIVYLGYYIFYELFSTIFSVYSLNLADQALDFYKVIISFIKEEYLNIFLLLIPIILIIIFNKYFNFNKINKKELLIKFNLIILIYLTSIFMLIPGKNKLYSVSKLYYNSSDTTVMVDKLGVLTTLRIDIKNYLFGHNEEIIINKPINKVAEEKIEYNNLNIDFSKPSSNSEINTLNNYFDNETGTNKNNYTGLLKGKNLIFILAEGFNEIAVDQNVTPTLYKLTHESFVFNDFYSPEFLSTTGGEFQALTGLMPTQDILNTWKSKTPKISFALGNSFNKLNYNTYAFHNWTYTYYKRDKTMPTLGFNNFLGCRNGLEKLMDCKSWPTSDINLMNVTNDLYMSSNPFMTYYISLSGHAEYNFSGNKIAIKNKDLVKDLPYSEQIRAYLATQIEFDKALNVLLTNLENKGILKDTVIAIVGDHYPYTISADKINEISTYKKDDKIEVNHSNFIIWNSELPTVNIDKVGSQIDVLPTLLNLFGIEYDSRLIMGKDILSDTEGLAIFSNRSWVSDRGTYNSSNKTFTPKDNKEYDQEYINKINELVANKFSLSKLIIDNNYYEYITKEL